MNKHEDKKRFIDDQRWFSLARYYNRFSRLWEREDTFPRWVVVRYIYILFALGRVSAIYPSHCVGSYFSFRQWPTTSRIITSSGHGYGHFHSNRLCTPLSKGSTPGYEHFRFRQTLTLDSRNPSATISPRFLVHVRSFSPYTNFLFNLHDFIQSSLTFSWFVT